MMITANMKNFVNANELSPIVTGERLTPDLRPIHTAKDWAVSNCVRYVLENGLAFVITLEDQQSTDYAPQWSTKQHWK